MKNEFAAALGRLGRGKTSEAKKKSSRINGLKGGRPKKVLVESEKKPSKRVLGVARNKK